MQRYRWLSLSCATDLSQVVLLLFHIFLGRSRFAITAVVEVKWWWHCVLLLQWSGHLMWTNLVVRWRISRGAWLEAAFCGECSRLVRHHTGREGWHTAGWWVRHHTGSGVWQTAGWWVRHHTGSGDWQSAGWWVRHHTGSGDWQSAGWWVRHHTGSGDWQTAGWWVRHHTGNGDWQTAGWWVRHHTGSGDWQSAGWWVRHHTGSGDWQTAGWWVRHHTGSEDWQSAGWWVRHHTGSGDWQTAGWWVRHHTGSGDWQSAGWWVRHHTGSEDWQTAGWWVRHHTGSEDYQTAGWWVRHRTGRESCGMANVLPMETLQSAINSTGRCCDFKSLDLENKWGWRASQILMLPDLEASICPLSCILSVLRWVKRSRCVLVSWPRMRRGSSPASPSSPGLSPCLLNRMTCSSQSRGDSLVRDLSILSGIVDLEKYLWNFVSYLRREMFLHVFALWLSDH